MNKAVIALKDKDATSKVIGDDENTRVIYLIYKEPIKDKVKEYVDDEAKRSSLLHEMQDDTFDELLDVIVEGGNAELTSDCNSYKPSMFEEKKKK